jgi:archaemetzincin
MMAIVSSLIRSVPTLAVGMLLATGCRDGNQRPVSAREALGNLDGVDPELRRAFEAAGDFRPLPTPQPGDWLYENPDEGQTFDQYVASEPNFPLPWRNKIYIQPIGESTWEPSLAELEDYSERYFGNMDVVVLPPISAEATGATTRVHGGHTQLLAPEVSDFLKAELPGNAYCLIGLTALDLYPQDDWNFVFGQASLSERVGVFSFARYDDAFFGDPPSPRQVVRRRALQVLTHEVGHMFGLGHCVHYSCNMNGSNSMEEADTQPSHLCPVCLRKLQHTIGFDPAAYYEALADFYEGVGMSEDAAFARRRQARIEGKLQ